MLTDDMQLLSIKNALAGEPLSYPAEYFSGHAAKIAKVIEWAQRTNGDVIKAIEPIMMIDPDVANLIAYIPMPKPVIPPVTPKRLSQMKYPPVQWLYPGYFVRGHANTIVADAGTGKNWFALDLAMKVSNGLPWPNNDGPRTKPGNVIWIDGENFMGGNKERVAQWMAAGMYEQDNIYPFNRSGLDMMYLGDKTTQNELVRWIDALRPELIVADSWDTLMESNTFKEDIQTVLDFIDKVSAAYNLCWLTLSHPHKRKFAKPTDPLVPDEAAGSRIFKGRHRMMWAMWFANTGASSRNTDPRILSLLKCNYKWPKISRFNLEMQPLHPDGLIMRYTEYKDMVDDLPPATDFDEYLEAIDTLEYPSTRKISEYLGLNPGVASRILSKMQQTGLIDREPCKKGESKPWVRK